MRFLFVSISILCITCCKLSFASTRCVKLSAETVCSSSADCYNTSDCTMDCNGVKTIIVGRCGSTSGTPDQTVATNFSTSTTAASNTYCWCALVSPITSKWVLRYEYYGSSTSCMKNCTRGCRNALIFNNSNDIAFRTVMFNNILE